MFIPSGLIEIDVGVKAILYSRIHCAVSVSTSIAKQEALTPTVYMNSHIFASQAFVIRSSIAYLSGEDGTHRDL